jgi:hypothetical protein
MTWVVQDNGTKLSCTRITPFRFKKFKSGIKKWKDVISTMFAKDGYFIGFWINDGKCIMKETKDPSGKPILRRNLKS